MDDGRYDFRTISGIKKTSKLTEEKIEEIIKKYKHLIRESPIRDDKNQRLFTLKRKQTLPEIMNIIRDITSKST